MRHLRAAAAALCLSALALSGPNLITSARAAEPFGTWYTASGESQIRITNCGGALCGSLVWLKEPNDPETGAPKTDKHNPDPGRQGRPLIGTQILLGLRPGGAGEWAGQLYNAEDGKTYSGSLTLTGANTADLKGCVLGGLICKSQTWTRAK